MVSSLFILSLLFKLESITLILLFLVITIYTTLIKDGNIIEHKY